ncbi:hypothetical protein J7L02_01095 [Candidatus Woesearchaeota archaeon]|nr:hypothetical protein [Candidatus Woesearchaeota archaeon]
MSFKLKKRLNLLFSNIATLLLFLIIASQANALSGEITLMKNGQPITVIASGVKYSFSARLVLHPDMPVNQVSYASADFSDLSQTAYWRTGRVFLSNCLRDYESNTLTCTVSIVKVFLTSKDNGVVNITIKNATSEEKTSVTISFNIDSEKPVVKGLGTEFCTSQQNGTCYYKPGQVKVFAIVEDDNPLNLANIYFRLGTSVVKASSCEDNKCIAIMNMPLCNEGSSRLLSIDPSSTDDAGNSIDLTNSTYRKRIYCDTSKPNIKELNISGSELGFVTNGELNIHAVVQDYSKVNLSVNLTSIGAEFKTVTCERDENTSAWICSLSATIQKPGPYTARLRLMFRDMVGNERVISRSIQVLGISEEAGVDLWNVKSVEVSPSLVDGRLLGNVNMDAFLHVQLNSKKRNAKLLTAEITDCYAVNNSPQILSEIPLVETLTENGDVIASVPLTGFTEETTTAEYTCSLKLVSNYNDMVQKPEFENISFKINIFVGKSPEELIESEIQAVEKRIASKKNTTQKVSNILKTTLGLCKLLNMITAFGTSMKSAQASVSFLEPTPFKKISDTVFEASKQVDKVNYVSKLGPIAKICPYLACQSKVQRAIPRSLASLPGLNSGITKYLANATGLNLEDYLDPNKGVYSAIISLCPTGVVNHMMRKLVIDCRYEACLEAAKKGYLSVQQCKFGKCYESQMLLFGDFLNIIPYTKILEAVGNRVQDLVSHPISSTAAAIIYLSCIPKFRFTAIGNALCALPKYINDLNEALTQLKQAKAIVDTVSQTFSLQQDACEQILEESKKFEDIIDWDKYSGNIKFCTPVGCFGVNYFVSNTGLVMRKAYRYIGSDNNTHFAVKEGNFYYEINPDTFEVNKSKPVTPAEGWFEAYMLPLNKKKEENLPEEDKQDIQNTEEATELNKQGMLREASKVLPQGTGIIKDIENLQSKINNLSAGLLQLQNQYNDLVKNYNDCCNPNTPPLNSNSEHCRDVYCDDLSHQLRSINEQIADVNKDLQNANKTLDRKFNRLKRMLEIAAIWDRPWHERVLIALQIEAFFSQGEDLLAHMNKDVAKFEQSWLENDIVHFFYDLGGWINIGDVLARKISSERCAGANLEETHGNYILTGNENQGFIGAIISGSRTRVNNTYFYTITARVEGVERDGFKFVITLDNTPVTKTFTLDKGKAFPNDFDVEMPLIINSTRAFTSVCLKVQNAHPELYFKDVNLQNNKLCSKLKIMG